MPKAPRGLVKDQPSLPVLQTIHPKSRKAQQKAQAQVRKDEKKRMMKDAEKKHQPMTELVAWIRMRLMDENQGNVENARTYSEGEVAKMYEEYLSQQLAEVEAMKARRKAMNTTEMMAAEALENQRKKWKSIGEDLPDLTKRQIVRNLLNWDGNPVHFGVSILNDASAIEFKTFKPIV